MKFLLAENFEQWRTIARRLRAENVSHDDIRITDQPQQGFLFGDRDPAADNSDPVGVTRRDTETCGSGSVQTPSDTAQFRVPKQFLSLAENVGFHRDPQRWNLLYRALWRLTTTTPALLELITDDDVLQLRKMEKEVSRDAHKMKAFVRFRKVIVDNEEHFIAWHQPDHRIVRKVAPFFSRRFKAMNWTILTPDESVVWDQNSLVYGPGISRDKAPQQDELEDLWRTYYANIFNPARVKIKMMKSEMPVRYWHTLPEAEIIADLIAGAPSRVEQMIANQEGFAETAADYIRKLAPPHSLSILRTAAEHCRACDLCMPATQTVFGYGPQNAKMVIVGEQPGDEEDISGLPFVGPAGQVLNKALAAAGIQREAIYLTNVVKHFKYQPRGKKRLHQKPDARDVRACRPWLDAEWAALDAIALVCLGSTAANALIAPGFRITKDRGEFVSTNYCEHTIATWHPSAILRAVNEAASKRMFDQLVADLYRVKTYIDQAA